jgi:hypothetical protein
MSDDSTEIARFPVEILEDGRRLVRVLLLTQLEVDEFDRFLNQFPELWEWNPQLEGWVSTD